MKKTFLFALILSLFSFSFYAQTSQIKVISPIEGKWLNKQLLLIDTSDGGDYFYSLNGSDPETMGFAYDGPVLIDLIGDITLRIKKAGRHSSETTVNFSVQPDSAFEASYADFISLFYDGGLYNYTSGSLFIIPSELDFSFGLPPDSFLQGRELLISDKSVLIRYIPCTIWDKKTQKKWRFMVKTFPQSAGVYSRRDVPFFITDWDKITFTNQDLIYKIDSEYWELPKTSKYLDRSVSHMISWQSIDYEFGNPIEYFVLPPKPLINKKVMDDGCVIFEIDGDSSYSFSILSETENSYQELYSSIGADTFYGDNASGKLDIGIFSNSVYQGKMDASYDIKKRPPSNPVITSTSKSFYSRLPVKVSIAGEKNCDLYVSTSSPLVLRDMSASYAADSEIFDNVKMSAYKKADSPSLSFVMEPQGEGTVYFKVRAYSVNGENIGNVSEYSVIIDQYNYYLDENADPQLADGTIEKPYSSFEQCIDSVNKGSYARLHVKGQITMPQKQVVLSSNCSIINNGNAKLLFPPKSSLVIRNSNFSLDNCLVELSGTDEALLRQSTPLIKLENSVLDLTNCQLSAQFGKNGTLIDGFSSSVNIKNDIIAISSKIYSSCVSGVKTKLKVQNSSINLTSDTAVAFSLNEGDISMKNNSLKIIGKKGRIGELFDVKGSVTDNSFRGQLEKTDNSFPVFKDAKSSLNEANNEYYGF